MTSHKRSLFKRPAWAKASTGKDEDLFRRSNRTYKVVQQVSLKESTHSEQASKPSYFSASSQRDLVQNSDDEAEQQLSDTVSSAKPSLDEQSKTLLETHQEGNGKLKPPNASPPSLLRGYDAVVKRKAQSRKRKLKQYNLDIIDLEVATETSSRASSESLLEVQRANPNVNPNENKEELDDDEFPELARLARERARRSRLERGPLQQSTAAADVGPTSANSIIIPTSSPSEHDPTVQILVTSDIADTQPLIVTRRLSQRLKDVRIAWVQHQRTRSGQLDHVFLTWRGKRVFDVVNCKGLGIIAEVPQEGPESRADGQIHMVAMTKESYDLLRQARDRKHSPDQYLDESISPPPNLAVGDESQIRIILQSRNFNDFKLIVKTSTVISKVVNAFRASNRIDANRTILLQFDGEHLEAEQTVGQTELTDLDHVEVYVK